MSEIKEIFLTGYETLTDGILITDTKTHILYFNRACKKILGLPKEVLNSTIRIIIPILSDQITELEELGTLLNHVSSDPYRTDSLQLFFKNGKRLDLQSIPIPDNDNKIIGRMWVFRDISESIQTSKRLEHSELLFKTIFNLIPEGIAISDIKTGKFVETNTHFTKWWGYTREEVIGKSAIDLNFWVDLNQREDIINRLNQNGSFEMIPVKMRRKDGEVLNILISGQIITIDNTPYMLSIPLDITSVLKYEEKIWSLASFIELSPNPIFEINGEGIITMRNEATVKIIQKLTGTTDIDRFIPDQMEEILNAIHNKVETTFYREITIEKQTFSEYIYITNQYHTARIYVDDITQKKRAEEELLRRNDDIATAYEEIASTEEELRENYNRLVEQENVIHESENKLRVIVDHIPGIVLTTDVALNITSLFGAGLKNIALSPNEGIGCRWEDVLKNPDKKFVEAHQKALQGIISTHEGQYFGRIFLLYTEPLLDVHGTIIGTMGIAIDITDQKRSEMDRNNLLLQLEHNLIELTVLNDKIRNPLTVISTLIEMHAPHIEEPVNKCVNDIDDIIKNLDKRWIESEKTIRFLRKHYGIEI
ncbi:MAG: hypothetical protein CVV33_00650 [Methanomicrobiales archaeon HGW-Methanomicrobiales-4]|nr:MAG: hypothetical protein CVV33_00650 [Methanomicrobiales archaeon HGW-Methanomicrobiales-4]